MLLKKCTVLYVCTTALQWHFTKHITVSCLYYRPPKEVACLILLLAATATHCYYYCNVAVRVSLEYIRFKN
uniref:Uncharacterized protein n=1 Tax=Glossina palpalis gambiensis TaxID=67801 RepID=A0A1B0BRV5_9MUSC